MTNVRVLFFNFLLAAVPLVPRADQFALLKCYEKYQNELFRRAFDNQTKSYRILVELNSKHFTRR